MIQSAAIAVSVVAFAAWVMAVTAALQMMRHRARGVSRLWFAFNGFAFFSGRNFLSEAEPYRRRFLRWSGIFALAIVAGMILAIAAAPPRAPQ